MNIYLCSQNENSGYDTYDSFICAAKDEESARNILPDSDYPNGNEWGEEWANWCSSPAHVDVELIGVAGDGVKHGVILASFNAG